MPPGRRLLSYLSGDRKITISVKYIFRASQIDYSYLCVTRAYVGSRAVVRRVENPTSSRKNAVLRE